MIIRHSRRQRQSPSTNGIYLRSRPPAPIIAHRPGLPALNRALRFWAARRTALDCSEQVTANGEQKSKPHYCPAVARPFAPANRLNLRNLRLTPNATQPLPGCSLSGLVQPKLAPASDMRRNKGKPRLRPIRLRRGACKAAGFALVLRVMPIRGTHDRRLSTPSCP